MTQQVRKTKKAQNTRKQLLEVALELFKEKGFDKTTMRDIAQRAELAVGAAYYHFRTKDEIVLAFYEETLEQFERESAEIITKSHDLETRLFEILNRKFEQLKPYRGFIVVLTRTILDPTSPLSPFGEGTNFIRERSEAVFEKAVQGCENQVPAVVRAMLPSLLWLYHMGLIFYWLNDKSAEQKDSDRLLEKSLKLIMQLLRMARLPLMGNFLKPALELVEEFGVTRK